MSTTTERPPSLVCGIDGSSHDARVVALAAALADRLGLRLRFVHSPDPDVFRVGEQRREALSRGAALVASYGGRRDEDHVVQLGDPAHILAAVIAEDAALAVIGSRGRRPARAALLGSVAGALAGRSPCPLVVVPPDARIDLARAPAIVCGLDGSAAAVDALQRAAVLADALGGRLLALHARTGALTMGMPAAAGQRQPFVEPLDAARAAIAIVEQPLAEIDPGIPATMRIASGSPAACLARVAGAAGSALIVVGSRGHGLLRGALLGSVSLRLAATAPVPVMIVPPRSAAQRAALPPERAFAAPVSRM